MKKFSIYGMTIIFAVSFAFWLACIILSTIVWNKDLLRMWSKEQMQEILYIVLTLISFLGVYEGLKWDKKQRQEETE